MLKPIAIATAIAGTLDLLAATVMTLIYARPVDGMLRSVASGPVPAATQWSAGGAVLGVVVHFALMAIMVTIYMLAASRMPALRRQPVLWGVLYGLATYIVMNLVVVPLRFGSFPTDAIRILPQLCFHIFLVGMPIALVAAHWLRPRRS